MPEAPTPTVRRWELGSRLRRAREAAGFSLEAVAQEMLCSTSKISRIETAKRGASLSDVRDLCRIYLVPDDERELLMQLVRDAKQPAWWQRFAEVDARSGTFIGLEAAAESIQSYEIVRIPGLLQTPGYVRALIRAIAPAIDDKGVEQYVDSRQERQERLLGPPASLQLWTIVDEAALHREVGGPDVMREQLGRLLEAVEARSVVLQVVPFAAGAHPGMDGTFQILQFRNRELADQVYVEAGSGQLFLNRPAELKLYRAAFDHLRAVAESPYDSARRIRRMYDAT